METGLEGRPWYFGLFVGLAIGGLALFAGYRIRLSEMQESIERQESRIIDLDDQIRRGEAARAQLPQFEERVEALEKELERLLVILPDRRNVHDVLRRFKDLAEREDFNLLQFTPSNEVEQDYFNEWPITLRVQGTYHNLARFFDRMSRLSRIFNIDTLTVNAVRSPTPSQTIDATFVAKTFVYKEDEGFDLEEGP